MIRCGASLIVAVAFVSTIGCSGSRDGIKITTANQSWQLHSPQAVAMAMQAVLNELSDPTLLAEAATILLENDPARHSRISFDEFRARYNTHKWLRRTMLPAGFASYDSDQFFERPDFTFIIEINSKDEGNRKFLVGYKGIGDTEKVAQSLIDKEPTESNGYIVGWKRLQ